MLKGQINLGHHMPFQQEFQTGGTSMRGWLNNQFRGDTRVLTMTAIGAKSGKEVPLGKITFTRRRVAG